MRFQWSARVDGLPVQNSIDELIRKVWVILV